MQSDWQALDAIYAAALDITLWPTALQKIADCFGDVGTVLLFQRDDGTIGTITSPSLAEAQRDYDANWRNQDLRTIRGFERGYHLRSDAATDRHLVSPDEIATHPIYTKFLAKHGLGWCAGTVIMPGHATMFGSASNDRWRNRSFPTTSSSVSFYWESMLRIR